MNKYYVYLLCDPRHDNQPFYVGKGCGDRVKRHLAVSSKASRENPWKCAKIQKIREAGLEPEIEYYATDLSEEDAYILEAFLIIKYGRAKIDEGGILTNQCIDRRPPPWPVGQSMPEETKQKIGAAQTSEKSHRYGKNHSDEWKQQRREFNLANGIKPPVRSGPMSDEQKAAIGAGNRGKKRTPEQSAHLSEIRKGKRRKPCPEEVRANIRNGLLNAIGKPLPPTDLTGMSFGLWTRGTDRRTEAKRGSQYIYWLCRCSCAKATEREVAERSLLTNNSQSCGCQKSFRV